MLLKVRRCVSSSSTLPPCQPMVLSMWPNIERSSVSSEWSAKKSGDCSRSSEDSMRGVMEVEEKILARYYAVSLHAQGGRAAFCRRNRCMGFFPFAAAQNSGEPNSICQKHSTSPPARSTSAKEGGAPPPWDSIFGSGCWKKFLCKFHEGRTWMFARIMPIEQATTKSFFGAEIGPSQFPPTRMGVERLNAGAVSMLAQPPTGWSAVA